MKDALQQYLDDVRDRPFEWGEHDCALFAAKAVDASRGTGFEAMVRRYGCRSALDYRHLQRNANVTLDGLTTAELGSPIDDVTQAQRGDVALLVSNGRQSLGVVVPPLILVASPTGTMPVAMTHAVKVWGVK